MRKAKEPPQLTVELKREEWERTLQGEVVLRCVLTWPECTGTWRGLERIGRYYRRAAEEWRRRWEREVYLRACLDLADRRAQSKPFKVWTARLDTCITRQGDGLLSLWQEGTEVWGYDRPLVLRRGDTWSLAEGAPRTLRSFLSGRGWKKRVLSQVEQAVQERLSSGETLLDPDCARRLKREFDPERYYLTQEGAEVFYPMYVLAPGGEGVPAFPICVSG